MLKGKNAVVTGSTSGIGLGVAEALAARGVNILLNGLGNGADIEALRARIAREHGVAVLYDGADMSKPAAIAAMMEKAAAAFGTVDILVNNAGIQFVSPVEDFPPEKWDAIIAINLVALFHTIRHAVPGMKQRKWGRIINVTGTSEPRGLNAAYSAKAAVYAWAKGLSREIGVDGITINSLAPGRILSEQIENRINPSTENREAYAQQNIPLGYFGDPADMAYAALFLASQRARYITGEILHIDGGMRRHAF